MTQYNSYQGGNPELQKLSSGIASNIQKISQNVKSIQQLVNQLGTDQDNTHLRSQLHQVQHYTGGLAKDTNTEISNLQNSSIPPHEDSKAWHIQTERLIREFTQALNNFQSVQRQAASKEKEALKEARAHTDAHYFDDHPKNSGLIDLNKGSKMSQVQIQMEQEAEIQALQERETQIRELESDIVDVNQIFKDLATMVYEQGEVIDSIEANVESTAINVTSGATQLKKAESFANKARRKKLYLFAILAVIIIIIIICWSLN